MNYCVLASDDADNATGTSNNIIFTNKNTKLDVLVITFSEKDIQKLSKLFGNGFERSVYWNEYKTKIEKKNMTNRYFLESNFVKRLFVWIYINQDNNSKRYKAKRYYLPKGIIKNYNIIVNKKNFYSQPIDSDMKYTKK